MSGYGGQGWQDPYQQGWSGNPYGGSPYGGSPYGDQAWQDPYAMPGYGPPRPPASQGAAVGALVCNILATVLWCPPLGIPGIVTAAMAMSRAETNPDSARTLTKWGWGLFIASVVFAIIVIALVIAAGILNSSGRVGSDGGYD